MISKFGQTFEERSVSERPLTRGGGPHGALPSEKIYISPSFPNGATELQIINAPVSEASAAIQFWFLGNFEPLPPLPYLTLDDGPGLDEGYLAPEHWAPKDILEREFGQFSPPWLMLISAVFSHRSSFWQQIQYPKSQYSNVDPQLVLAQKVYFLEQEIQKLSAVYGQAGHNREPILVNQQNELIEAIKNLKTLPDDKNLKRQKILIINASLGVISTAFISELAKHAADDMYDPIKIFLIRMIICIQEVIIAALHIL